MTTDPYSKIIYDAPADADAFSGKGHERAAKALAESIRQLADERDGAIGLEGPWGAGKSTVIELATKALNEAEDSHQYEVFAFDLWTHHTTDFRRAFLEEFINWLEKRVFLSKAEIKRQRGIVRNRLKAVDTTLRRGYSLLGALLIVFLPLLPLAYAWVSPSAFSSTNNLPPVLVGFTAPEVLLRLLVIGGILPLEVILVTMFVDWLLWPLVVGTIVPAYRRAASKTAVAKSTSTDPHTFFSVLREGRSIDEITSNILSIFSRESRKNTVTEAIRDEDPSSVEFYRVFRDLLSLVQKKDRRVVFVLDNIDRLPAESVPAAWSEVRSVFATDDARRLRPHSRVTAVVPYDRRYVKAAFAPNKAVQESTVGRARFAEEDVFNKTFNRILKVSPPVASDWGAFLEQMLDKAFGSQFDDVARYKLFRLLQLYQRELRLHPTPRTIVGFVNEIGPYWAQWGRSIPPESIALYVLFRSKIEESPEALTEPDIIQEQYLYAAAQPEWRRHLAALLFNVELELANQVLLGDPIARALDSTDAAELSALAKLEGFPRVFENELASALDSQSSPSAIYLCRAAQNVSSLSLPLVMSTTVWRRFARSLSTVSAATLGDASAEELDGLFQIAARQPESDVAAVAASLRDLIVAAGANSSNEFDQGRIWALRLKRLVEAISSRSGPEKAQNFWSESGVAQSGEFAVGALTEITSFPDYRYATFKVHTPIATIYTVLDQYVANDPENYRPILQELLPLLGSGERIQAVTSIAAALRAKVVEPSEAASLIASYEMIERSYSGSKSEVSSVLQKLVADGTLPWYGARAATIDPTLEAQVVLLMVKRLGAGALAPSPDPHPALGALGDTVRWYQEIGTAGLGEATGQALHDAVLQSGSFSAWVKFALTDTSASHWLQTTVGGIILSGARVSFELAQLVASYVAIRAALGPKATVTLLRESTNQLTLDETRNAVPDANLIGLPREFLEDAATLSDIAALNDISDRLDRILATKTASDWLEALRAQNDLLKVLATRNELGGLTLPPHTYLAPLAEFLVEVATGSGQAIDRSTPWGRIVEALPQGNRRTLAEQVLSGIPTSGVPSSAIDLFVDQFGEVANLVPWAKHEEQSVGFLRALVASDAPESRAFLRGHAKAFSKILKKLEGRDEQLPLVEVVDGVEQVDADHAAWASEVRDLLGLPKPAVTEQGESLDQK